MHLCELAIPVESVEFIGYYDGCLDKRDTAPGPALEVPR